MNERAMALHQRLWEAGHLPSQELILSGNLPHPDDHENWLEVSGWEVTEAKWRDDEDTLLLWEAILTSALDPLQQLHVALYRTESEHCKDWHYQVQRYTRPSLRVTLGFTKEDEG